jgi:hypothetical protein
MDLFLDVQEDKVIVMATVKTDDYIGDIIREIGPGDSFGHLTYEALREAGSGLLQVEAPPPAG